MTRMRGFLATLNRPLVILVLIAVLAAASLFTTSNTAYAQSPDNGESVFAGNCAACHSTGEDTIIGPGLSGLADRAGSTVDGQSADDYLRESIVDPTAFVVDGFAAGLMPAIFEASLSAGDLDDLVAYLGTLGSGAAPAEAGAGAPEPELISAQVIEGDAARGENLFTGPTRFENRGPSCSACHSSSGIGALGGGSLGPDLTGAFEKLGEAMILFPETSKTMKPIFTEKPLTDQEKADLLAFFKTADISERDTQEAIVLFGVALGGLAVIVLFTHLIWRRRLRGVRKPMVGNNPIEKVRSRRIDTSTLLLAAFLLAIAGSIAGGLSIIVVTVT